MKPTEGRKRVLIEAVQPLVDCGRYPVRRFLGDQVTITAAVFGDGHDHVAGQLLYRHESETPWRSVALTPLGNDLWTASFVVDKLGGWSYSVQAWVDHIGTWCADLTKRLAAQPEPSPDPTEGHEQPEGIGADPVVSNPDIPLALRTGAALLADTAERAKAAKSKDALSIQEVALALSWLADQNAAHYEQPVTPEICELANRFPKFELATRTKDFNLWENLHEVFAYWIRQGVKIFRVDNPHTKALPFWEWCIAEVHASDPDVIFLAEAFTRPHVMYALAKSGFSQSYTYFTWRTEKAEIEQYFEEITKPPVSDFFTPNLWPNTPDILHASLQTGGRPAFMQRLILAATLGASYGIYGPAYELCENLPVKPNSEEYLNSEKYEIRQWDLAASHSIAPLITRVNQIRRENIALQSDLSLHFHPVDNPQVICYSKNAGDNIILVALNLDPHNEQAGWIDLDLKILGMEHDETFDVEDLLTGTHYAWHDRSNFVALRPDVMPAHNFRVTHNPIKTASAS